MYPARPQPEITEGGRRKWRVSKSPNATTGRTNIRAAEMLVPLDASPSALAIRCHEMLHVRHSPDIARLPHAPGIDPDLSAACYLAAEDGRIESEPAWTGSKNPAALDAHSMATHGESFTECGSRTFEDLRDHAVLALACTQRPLSLAHCLDNLKGSPYEPAVMASLALIAHKPATKKKPVKLAAPAKAKTAAALLAAALSEPVPGPTPPPPPRPPACQPDPEGADSYSSKTAAPGQEPRYGPKTLPGHAEKPAPAYLQNPYKRINKHAHDPGTDTDEPDLGGVPGVTANRETPWARLFVQDMPRPRTAWRMGSRPPTIGSDEGVAMIRPERFATDGKVFGRRRSLASIGAVRSVAVLIDASGSMRFSTTDLSNILATAPAATVATYAAPGPRSSDWALVRVWSKDGAVADETEIKKAHYYEGPRNTVLPLYENRIDGPALAWLADLQAKIKVWYTDTHVTDNSAGFSPRLQNACIQFCEDHDIRIARRDYGQSLDECLRASTWNPGV